jgi:MFS transporter, DHA1 family, multidrug resistance protein
MSRMFLIVFCGLLLTSNAFSTDVLMPAVFAMEIDLKAPIAQVQIALPIFIFASAFGQLVFGPASDRFGRKPVLLVGLATYTAAALLASTATTIEVVLGARALQGFGSAAAVVLGRAILRDTHSGSELARTMALAMAVITVGPVLAPLVGTGLVAFGGWRPTFVAMALFGIAMSAVAFYRLKETNHTLRSDALDLRELKRAMQRVLTHPQSRFFLSVSAVLGFTIISFIAHAPRIFKSAFGVDGMQFALSFALLGLGIVVGQVFNARAITRFGVLATTKAAASVLAVVCSVMAVLAAAKMLNAVGFGVLMFLFNCAYLSVIANAASLTIDPHAEIAGLASSVYGFVTQLVPGAMALLTLGVIAGDLKVWATLAALTTVGVLAALCTYRPLASASTVPV